MPEPAAVIRWEEPPPSRAGWGRGRPCSRYMALADQLRARAGEWALIREADTPNRAASLAGLIREGRVVCFGPRGDFDACTRSVDGRYRVYARYLGDPEAGHA